MRERAVICFLIAAIMLIYGIGYLPFDGEGIAQVFAWGWVAFAIIVLIGNAIQLLYIKRVQETKAVPTKKLMSARQKLRG